MLEMTITLIRLSEASNSFSGLLLVFFQKKKYTPSYQGIIEI
jgi:hypothetical protein